MEFLYRAGDERRSRSLTPPASAPPAEPSASASGSVDGHGGNGSAERVGNSAVQLWQPAPTPPPMAPASAEELRRQAEKERIRERILREETEQLELELEVRREIREQLLHLSWPTLRRSAGSDPPAASSSPVSIVAANSSLPVVTLEAHPKVDASATSPAKRKSPDHTAASKVSAATSSKKQKVTLTCVLCGITANSEKTMQDHFNGKVHKRKAAVALLELPKLVPEPESKSEPGPEPETAHQTGEEAAVAMSPSEDYTPTKLTMMTNTGSLNKVMQMDGYLLCEVCNVRTADRVTMMCHLEGDKHISKDQKKHQASMKLPDEVARSVSTAEKGVNSVPEADTSAVASADPETLVLGVHGVRRLEGFLLCELCDVKAPSMKGMQQHLSGKKHNNKVKASPGASVNVSTSGKEAAKAEPPDNNTAAVNYMASHMEAPLAKDFEAKVGDDSELQQTTVVSTKEDVATGDSTKTPASANQVNNVCESDSLTLEVDNVQHPLLREGGILVCPCCNTKAPSEISMQYHLAGKKHKHKMALAAQRNKDVSVLATRVVEVQGNTSKSTKVNVEAESAQSVVVSVPQAKNADAMAPMEVDRPAEDRPATHIEPKGDGEITRVQSNSPKSMRADEEAESAPSLAEPQAKNAVAMAPMEVDGPAEVHPVTIMVLHPYTSTNCGKTILEEKKEEEQA